ncbi:MAG: carboxylating nicotinate-nucleotide diphosphorylase [Bacteriovoracia bacterium]
MRNALKAEIEAWLKEDGVGDVAIYWQRLPNFPSRAQIKIKSDITLAGLPWFIAVFETLDKNLQGLESLMEYEGQHLRAGTVIDLPVDLPWGVAITGERLALNLLHKATAVATATKKLTETTSKHGVAVLDTRKTTPGLRNLEKYAVTVGGGKNHRFTQVDAWMIKDNHKELMGLKGAVDFFRSMQQPYKNLIVEIHSLDELKAARELNVTHFLLDNFTPEMLKSACSSKVSGEFFEVSGGVNLQTVSQYMIPGVDAVSSGAITQFPAAVDISFKFQAVKS